VYLLNLMFDVTETDGRFSSDDPSQTNPLLRSKVWLQLTGGADPSNVSMTTFNPESLASGLSWTPLSSDGSLLTSAGTPPFSGATVPPVLAVRIAPVSALAAALHVAVIFGREPRSIQPFASPFTLDDTPSGATCAVFDYGDLAIPTGQTGLYLPLRPIANKPSGTSVSHHYEFEIGLIVNDGVFTFGHDPEVDVSM
jgi:hypothetical protein